MATGSTSKTRRTPRKSGKSTSRTKPGRSSHQKSVKSVRHEHPLCGRCGGELVDFGVPRDSGWVWTWECKRCSMTYEGTRMDLQAGPVYLLKDGDNYKDVEVVKIDRKEAEASRYIGSMVWLQGAACAVFKSELTGRMYAAPLE